MDPPFQVTFDENKTEEMVEAYNKNPQFFLSKSLLTIAIVIIGEEKETYLMDGQHRMEMIKQIYERTTENNKVIFAIHMIYSEDEMRVLFDELNKDSTKSKPYVSLPIFSKKKVDDVRNALISKYEGSYAKSKNKSGSLYSVGEFVSELIENDYFENDNTANEILEIIDTSHKKYFSKLNYLENGDDDKLYTATEMKTIKEHKNVMFFKNNNFIDYLVSNNVPVHDDLTKRTKIPENMRQDVWKKEFGSKTSTTCPVKYCDHQISNEKFGFQCGHKISVANGGKEKIDNLRPICADCNSKMSSTNWDSYEEELEREHTWESEYGDDIDGECSMCDKQIKKENFYLIKVDNKKKRSVIRLVCRKCSRDHYRKL